jgi:hypothetical protein
MNFSTAFKVFELNVLRQVGVSVTPQQVGLKSDPIADLQAKNATSGFSNILGNLSNLGNTAATSATGLTPPVPPTPPADPTDAAAQTKYQQDLLTYQNNFQIFNQRFMQLMLGQIQALQQSINLSNQQSSTNTKNSGGDSSSVPVGVGGILDI